MIAPLIPALLGVALEFVPKLFDKDKPLTTTAMEGIAKTVETVTGTNDPELARERLKNDLAMQSQLQDAAIRELEIHAKDRDSSRNMQTELAKAKHASAYAPAIISLIVTLGFFGMMYIVFNKAVPEGSEQLANILLGVLGAGFTQVLNFWLGSSKSSQDKTMLMGGGK